jgi:hypothetical protein
MRSIPKGCVLCPARSVPGGGSISVRRVAQGQGRRKNDGDHRRL